MGGSVAVLAPMVYKLDAVKLVGVCTLSGSLSMRTYDTIPASCIALLKWSRSTLPDADLVSLPKILSIFLSLVRPGSSVVRSSFQYNCMCLR